MRLLNADCLSLKKYIIFIELNADIIHSALRKLSHFVQRI